MECNMGRVTGRGNLVTTYLGAYNLGTYMKATGCYRAGLRFEGGGRPLILEFPIWESTVMLREATGAVVQLGGVGWQLIEELLSTRSVALVAYRSFPVGSRL